MKKTIFLLLGVVLLGEFSSVLTSEKPVLPATSPPALGQAVGVPSTAGPVSPTPYVPTTAGIRNLIARLPLEFVENRGQLDNVVRYSAKLPDGTVFFTPEEIVYQFLLPGKEKTAFSSAPGSGIAGKAACPRDPVFERDLPTEHRKLEAEEIRIRFVGANRAVHLEARDDSGAKFSYFRGKDPKKWVSNAPAYGKIIYQELYPHIGPHRLRQGRPAQK